MPTTVQVTRYHPTVPIGEVITTDPPPGQLVADDAVITVYVSLGPAAANRWTGLNSQIIADSFDLTVAAAAGQSVSAIIAVFVHCDFADEPLYASDANVSVTWGGQEWMGIGKFGSIEAVAESLELIAQPVRLTLSGVDPTLIASAMNSQYHGRDITIYLGVFDAYTLALLDTPEELWKGFMDVIYADLAKNSAVLRLDCEHWMRRQPKASRWTDEDQRSRFAGDLGFDRLWRIQGAIGKWGEREPAYGGGGGGGGGRNVRQKH